MAFNATPMAAAVISTISPTDDGGVHKGSFHTHLTDSVRDVGKYKAKRGRSRHSRCQRNLFDVTISRIRLVASLSFTEALKGTHRKRATPRKTSSLIAKSVDRMLRSRSKRRRKETL